MPRTFIEPDVSHTTPATAQLLTAYHRAKWNHDLDAWLAHFADDAVYADATLGWWRADPGELRQRLAASVPGWGDGRSWATRIVGDDHGAIVWVTDDPQLFGGELRTLSAVTIRDGAVVRFVDYWDSRAFGTTTAERLRTPDDRFPAGIEASDPRVAPQPAFARLCGTLHGALADGDVDRVVAVLGPDATWTDLTLNTRVVGPAAIGRYLARCAGRQPYAHGSELLDVVGGAGSGDAGGGGWTWRAPGRSVRNGVVAVEVASDGTVEAVTAVWDAGRLDDAELGTMTAWATEPRR